MLVEAAMDEEDRICARQVAGNASGQHLRRLPFGINRRNEQSERGRRPFNGYPTV